MMTQDILLSDDAHYQVKPTMKDTTILVFGETGAVKLIVATEADQAALPEPRRRNGASTLAIDMDRHAAMKLLLQLHEFSNRMGWPLQEVTGTASHFQSTVRSAMSAPERPRR